MTWTEAEAFARGWAQARASLRASVTGAAVIEARAALLAEATRLARVEGNALRRMVERHLLRDGDGAALLRWAASWRADSESLVGAGLAPLARVVAVTLGRSADAGAAAAVRAAQAAAAETDAEIHRLARESASPTDAADALLLLCGESDAAAARLCSRVEEIISG